MTKFTKEQARYKEPPFPGGIVMQFFFKLYPCANCSRFIKPNGCQIVEGEIKPDATCFYYSAFGLRPNYPQAANFFRFLY